MSVKQTRTKFDKAKANQPHCLYKKRNLRGKALTLYKNELSLTAKQKDILIGTLLGDASMQAMPEGQQFNIKFEQSIKQQIYIEHLYEELSAWVGTPPKIRDIKGGNASDRQSIWFRTYRHPSFSFYKNIFYKKDKDGKQYKIVPTLIHRWLTARSLAYWFMDDGSASLNKEKTKIISFVFHTQGFNLADIKRLTRALGKNFGFCVSIHKDKQFYKICVLKQSHEDFIKIISPYILPSFYYKIYLNK